MPRWIGLDLHKRVLEVCIVNDAGAVESRHRVTVTREQLKTFAQEHLHPDDRIAVEATTNTWPVVELLRPFVAEIVVHRGVTSGGADRRLGDGAPSWLR